ncbi:hypothetical protein ACFPIK_05535 [Algoriphagus aquatilis]|uniref:HEPN AbiU2-like domain-containing protein n=1 Tax=Algoriphagus aquatilis TaxID=490186 RepID=A0ABW0BW04_9BACT
MALNLCHRSLTELIIIAEQKEKGNNCVCNSDTIKFYQFTLHYMFVLEICKLLEARNISKEANYASLYRLNIQVLESIGNDYKSSHDSINKELNEISESNLFKKIKDYRHKKLAHSDRNQEFGPLNFKGFSKNELKDCKLLLEKVTGLFNLCMSKYENEFHFPKISTTFGFLTNYEDYRSYAFLDYRKFLNWKTLNVSELK